MKSFIYVYGELGDNLVKVGVTTQPNKRWHSLRTATRRREAGYLFLLPYGYGAIAVERKAHKRLAGCRIDKNGEWFLTSAQAAALAVLDAARECDALYFGARMSDLLTSEDLNTERATEPPKRWRNKWLLPYAFTGQNTGRIYGPGVEWSSKTWPSRDVAETHAKRQMAIYPLREYLGAYPEGERA